MLVPLLTAGAGFFIWQKNKDRKEVSNSSLQDSSRASVNERENNAKAGMKTFDCQDTFTLIYPVALKAIVTDAGQCLISNIDADKMPPVGPMTPSQLGLFFATESTNAFTGKEYLTDYAKRSQQDYPLELKL